jgi:hypothetical protein
VQQHDGRTRPALDVVERRVITSALDEPFAEFGHRRIDFGAALVLRLTEKNPACQCACES